MASDYMGSVAHWWIQWFGKWEVVGSIPAGSNVFRLCVFVNCLTRVYVSVAIIIIITINVNWFSEQ